MNKTIPKDIPNYTYLTPDKLTSRMLNPKEEDLIANFIKKYNKKNRKDMIMTVCIGLFFTFFTVYNCIRYGFRSFWEMFIGCAALFIVAFFISRKILPPVSSCQYIQLGQLHGVWSLRNNSSHSRIYYFDVVFPDSHTRIKNVNCTRSEYSTAQPGDYILTFSYDGKTSYGCIFRY